MTLNKSLDSHPEKQHQWQTPCMLTLAIRHFTYLVLIQRRTEIK